MLAVRLLICLCLVSVPVLAADLPIDQNWSALASDRIGHKVGDTVTVLIYETATATNSANSTLAKSSDLSGQARIGNNSSNQASFALGDGSRNSGSTGRSGQMVAQISAVIDAVLPNGDLHLSGAQTLNVNGERTNIRLMGRVRPADIGPDNTVFSARLADAAIDYDGHGFVSSSSEPGIFTRVLHWLGIP